MRNIFTGREMSRHTGWLRRNLQHVASPTESSYRIAFERLWDEKSSQTVSNGKHEHAAALFTVFLSKAEKSVVFFCKELLAEVYDDECVLNALDTAIGNGVSITVYVQDHAAADSKFAQKIRTAQLIGKPVEIREDLPEPGKSLSLNFAYVDDRAFRFESDHQKMEAVAAAWNQGTVRLLQNLFFQIKAGLPHVIPAAARNPASS